MEPRPDARVELTLIGVFLVTAVPLWVAGGFPSPGLTGVWLGLLSVLLAGVEFRVGKGRSTPLELAFVPMLLLLAPLVVPLMVAAAMIAVRLPRWVRAGGRRRNPLVGCIDAMPFVGPALLLALAPAPGSVEGEALLIALAFAALIAVDALWWPWHMWFASRIDPRTQLRPALWIYGIDAMLLPIGFAIAIAAREVPAAPLAILPLAALLAFFARERRLRAEQEQTLHTISHATSTPIVMSGRDGRTRFVNEAAQHLLGGDATDGSLLDHVHPDDVATVTRFLASAPGEAEFRLRHDSRHVHAVAADLTNDPHVRGLVVTIRDDEARVDLRRRASHDPLTGLANRTLLHERIAAADGEVSVLYLDLDGFKPINDRFGHAAGDEVLRLVARRLERCVRAERDTVARLGGDEFAILVREAADEVAERVRAAFDAPFTVDGEPLRVGASVGLATGAPDADALLAKADRAMYAVKRHL